MNIRLSSLLILLLVVVLVLEILNSISKPFVTLTVLVTVTRRMNESVNEVAHPLISHYCAGIWLPIQ